MSLDISIKKHFDEFDLNVTFEVGDETFGLLGASGCGKSLTMRCIAGIETPDEGHIVVNGVTFFDSQKGINLTAQQRKTALLFQNYMLFPNLTVEENVGAGIGREASKRERANIIDAELERFDLGAFRKRYPAQLSGGQQQRVALARMLAAKPGILMLDEPFSALDSHLKGLLEQNLINLFGAYSGTILYVSHDIDEAMRFCDRIAVVDNGKIREIAQGRELVSSPKSLASIKLTGCKNATEAQWIDDHHVLCPRWGVTIRSDDVVSPDVRYLGIRAFYLEQAEEPGENVFEMHVDRVSDSRFDRTVLLSFANRLSDPKDATASGGIHQLHQRVMWRISLLHREDTLELPEQGDSVLIRFRSDRMYLVNE